MPVITVNIKHIEACRIIHDIKHGIPVIIEENNKSQYLVLALDKTNKDFFTKLKSCINDCHLCLSANRINFITCGQIRNGAQISCQELNWQDILDFAFATSVPQISWKITGDFLKTILSFLESFETIPAIITARIKNSVHFYQTIHIDKIDYYLSSVTRDVHEVSKAKVITKYGQIQIMSFCDDLMKNHYGILIQPDKLQSNLTPIVRIHSSCFTGDLMYSLQCDCHDQLHKAIELMVQFQGGILIYLNQEGRGIGLSNKIRVYDIMSKGYDTVEANNCLGFSDDIRSFQIAANILLRLKKRNIILLSNNPKKSKELEKCGIHVVKVVKHQFLQPEIIKYYHTKATKMNHDIKS